MRRIHIWVYEGFSAAAATGPIDVLLAANAVWGYLHREEKLVRPVFDWRIESPDGRPVRSASGCSLEADGAIGSGGPADAVFLPALFVQDVPSLFETLERLTPVVDLLRAEHARGTLIAASCTSAFLLGEAGLLDGRHATVHWAFAKVFQRAYPRVEVRAQEMTTEGDRIWCAAGAAYTRLALKLVEKFAGAGLANATGDRLFVDVNRTPSAVRDETTLQDALGQRDPIVTTAQRWMQRRLKAPFQLAELASDLGVSERTINRRFNSALGQTPVTYLQTLRVETGKRFLETTKMSVESVAALVGYSDVNFFRRIFKRMTGFSPREYHHQFRRRPA
jgi:transcriptional regulator GlxA family with amidase domain